MSLTENSVLTSLLASGNSLLHVGTFEILIMNISAFIWLENSPERNVLSLLVKAYTKLYGCSKCRWHTINTVPRGWAVVGEVAISGIHPCIIVSCTRDDSCGLRGCKNRPAPWRGDRLHKVQAKECLWLSWFDVLFHCFVMYCLVPWPYVIYVVFLWHDIACLCYMCR